ncbi:hypothetical protein COEREDRAFT_89494 [Coemansia reversa NRRL 1564]|uniref:Uncharacterized protein n=1 Tax=Coemansia reversa (strain ATCC 12441 / NRRL 1564) TaxID=763665 RepID=A0A2G5B3D0_COERN|nr:hypothetical protein COEREDRAFT_89494 [Coemansia reversa NRRL 1564]|eukprot:PIA13518.1 hypothetical protein COEREDRAFT_89494 [Coemansia reversa NRRL 1564]
MARKYTFFCKALSKDAFVYKGEFESEPQDGLDLFPLYKIEFNKKSLLLWKDSLNGTHTILTGKYEGFTRSTVTISGSGLQSTAKRNSLFSDGWSFVYMADKFKWRVPASTGEWCLINAKDQIIAKFNRATSIAGKIGCLHLGANIDNNLEALVVLTCEIVHRTVNSSEQTAATAHGS